MGFGFTLTLEQPGKELTEHRRILQQAIGPRALDEYDDFLGRGCLQLLEHLEGFSGEPFDHVIKYALTHVTR